MASNTTNLNLTKPDITDNIQDTIPALASNFETIDGKLNEHTAQMAQIPTLANTVRTPKTVKYIAHRGLSAIAPENTIPSYELAGKVGLWGAETDIMTTSDGHWILMHDETVDRTTNGTGTVSQMTLAQIRALTIDFGNNIGLYPNMKVPTFEEYLLTCKKFGLIPVPEIKAATNLSDYDTLVNQIKAYGFEESCIIISFSLSALQEVRSRSKKIILEYLAPQIDATTIAQVKELGNAHFNINYQFITKESIELAHSNGLMVNVWTVDSPQMAKTFIGYGIDFITTNILAEVV